MEKIVTEGDRINEVLLAPDGAKVFDKEQWMGRDSVVLYFIFQDRYILAIPEPYSSFLYAIKLDNDFRDFDYPRNVIYIIDSADDRVLYRVDLEYAVLVDISKGYAWGRDPQTGELRKKALEAVQPQSARTAIEKQGR